MKYSKFTFYEAIRIGDLAAVKKIIQKYPKAVNIMLPDYDLQEDPEDEPEFITPLVLAMLTGEPVIMEILLKNGANVNKKVNSRSPINFALESYPDGIDILLKYKPIIKKNDILDPSRPAITYPLFIINKIRPFISQKSYQWVLDNSVKRIIKYQVYHTRLQDFIANGAKVPKMSVDEINQLDEKFKRILSAVKIQKSVRGYRQRKSERDSLISKIKSKKGYSFPLHENETLNPRKSKKVLKTFVIRERFNDRPPNKRTGSPGGINYIRRKLTTAVGKRPSKIHSFPTPMKRKLPSIPKRSV